MKSRPRSQYTTTAFTASITSSSVTPVWLLFTLLIINRVKEESTQSPLTKRFTRWSSNERESWKKKGYIRIVTNLGNLNCEVWFLPCSESIDSLRPRSSHGLQLHVSMQKGILQQYHLPQTHQRIHDSGRRPHGYSAWLIVMSLRNGYWRRLNLRRTLQGWVPSSASPQGTGHTVYGQQRTQYQQKPILHHFR